MTWLKVLFVFDLGVVVGFVLAAFLIAVADTRRDKRARRSEWQGPLRWDE